MLLGHCSPSNHTQACEETWADLVCASRPDSRVPSFSRSAPHGHGPYHTTVFKQNISQKAEESSGERGKSQQLLGSLRGLAGNGASESAGCWSAFFPSRGALTHPQLRGVLSAFSHTYIPSLSHTHPSLVLLKTGVNHSFASQWAFLKSHKGWYFQDFWL